MGDRDYRMAPPKFDWSAKDRLREIRLFRCQLEDWFEDNAVAEDKQMRKTLQILGKEGYAAKDRWVPADVEDKEDYKKFLDYLKGIVDTEVTARVRLHELEDIRMRSNETVDELVDRIREMARLARIHDESEAAIEFEVQRRLIKAIPDCDKPLRKELLKQPLDKSVSYLLDICRTYYMVESGAAQMCDSKPVHAIRTQKGKPQYRQKNKQSGGKQSESCTKCTAQHAPDRKNCPAKDSKCGICGKIGHWSKKCYHAPKENTKPQQHRGKGRRYKTHAIDVDEPSELTFDEIRDEIIIQNIQMDSVAKEECTEAFVKLYMLSEATGRPQAIRAKVDCGSGGNVLPLRVYKQLYPDNIDAHGKPMNIEKVHTRMYAYDGGRINVHGAIVASTEWRKPGRDPKQIRARWYIADTDGPIILGLPSSQKLNVMTLSDGVELQKSKPRTAEIQQKSAPKPIKTTQDLINQYPDRFEGLSQLPGEFTIHLKEGAKPVQHAPRHCPIALQPKVKEELDDMEAQGIIVKVNTPTDWVASATYAKRDEGRKIRVCFDGRDINKAIRREHHKAPTVPETTHKMAGSRVFSKFDMYKGYNGIKLAEKSSYLTTFNTPFGRYRYLRVPFGLICSGDEFQRRMDQMLEGATGCISIADDIVVHSRTDEEHDQHIHNLMEIARKYGIVFNPKKTHIKTDKVFFFGEYYDKDGAHPDPAKVKAVHEMGAPKNVTQLQEFLGMVQYLSPFIRGLSDLTAPLRELQKKDVDFQWHSSYQAAMDRIKAAIIDDATLRYFDVNKEVTIQVDASQVGLGAVLLQEGKPVAYASKALTPTEQRYANIEREMLAVVFGAEKFHNYVYGRHFTIESDHKPLEAITKKALADTPVRLQRMLLRMQGYDYTLNYKQGKEVLIADALSRYNPCEGEEIALEVTIHSLINMSENAKSSFQQEISTNPEMKELTRLIIDGWPEDIKAVPKLLRPYWKYRESLSVEDGLILKGETLVIPPGQRVKTLESLHKSHQGVNKTQLLARNLIFWPGYTAAIEEMVKRCDTCLKYQAQQAATPLEPTPAPSRPWQIVATDLFTFDGRNYLVIGDYYSKMHLVRKYPKGNSSSGKTINFLKEVFSEQSIPEVLRSDNGPQFDSAEFRDFCQAWNIEHRTSSPHYPQSNGFAEAMVKIVKGALQRAKDCGTDPHLALLDLRATPVDAHLPSPAELLNRRRYRTTIPSKIRDTQPESDNIRDRLDEKGERQKAYNDQHARPLAPLYVGQSIAWYDRGKNLWFPGKIIKKLDHNSYYIRTQIGGVLRRTRRDLRERQLAFKERESELSLRPHWMKNCGQTYVQKPPAAQALPTQVPAAKPAAANEAPGDKPPDKPPPSPRRSGRIRKPPERLIEQMK